MSSQAISVDNPKIGQFRRGIEMTKSAWHVLKLDKELTLVQLYAVVATIVAAVLYIGVAIAGGWAFLSLTHHTVTNGESIPEWLYFIGGFGLYFLTTLVANFFSGAIIYGATERFNGDDPTIKSSIAGARRKLRPLAGFSLMVSTVGIILQSLEERLPFAGKIAAYLFDAAWNIANVFAIPVIVLSKENVSPLQATKRSVGIIKKIWGESIIVNLGIGFVAALSTLVYILIAVGVSVAVASLGGSYFVIPVVLAIIGLFALMLIFSTLGSIAKAALYHYATTGEAPATFKRELLESTMTAKKARKIFG